MSTDADAPPAAATDETFKAHFAANLTRLRQAKGLNRAEFARLVDVDKMRITRLESGDHAPGGALLLRIAAALDTTAEALAADPTESVGQTMDPATEPKAATPKRPKRSR